jgi:very-short-patch-repair endonuclease
MSALEDTLLLQITATGLPRPEREYRFHPTRKWRFDFAWPAQKVAAEVEGATWARGRHTRGAGYEADCQKYNTAVLGGWHVVRFTAAMVAGGEALGLLEDLLAYAEAEKGVSPWRSNTSSN